MLKRHTSAFIITALVWLTSACTGGKNATTVSTDQGGFRITPGDRIELDLTDLVELGFSSDLSITLKYPSEDYKTTKTLLDLTDFIVNTPSTDNRYKIILPKDIAGIRPMIVLIEAPSLRAQFTDVIYADTSLGRPGIASSLAYDLLKYYPGKTFSSFKSSDFTGIKNLIQTRVDQVKSETEQLSLSSVRFDRVMRFYKNTLAFNPTFLNAIHPFGIEYGYSLMTPDGVQAPNTPEGSLASYQYAGNFTVNGSPAAYNPFNQANNPTRMSTATPGLGMNISALEGSKINLSANALDPDDDFIDKSFIIKYTPRKLPKHLPAGVDPTNLPKAEPVSSYQVISDVGKPEDPAIYQSDAIGYNEAINKINYKKGLLANTDCDADDSDPDCGETAFKDIYLLATDGMVRVPYRWNFKYIDINREPKIIANANNRINDTTLDDQTIAQIQNATSAYPFGGIAAVDGPSTPGAFRQHASHCETDPNILEQNIRARADGPWSCVFRSYDPDLDEDPNAAMDVYHYTVANYEASTEITTNGQKISPSATGPKVVTGAILSSCVDDQGVTHNKCGLALYSITVDNSVKIAAASKASLEYSYDIVVTDRKANGFRALKTITRKIKFTPIPPRFVNFDSRTKSASLSDIGKTYTATEAMNDPSAIEGTYARNDIYIDEVLANARAVTPNASMVGFKETLFDASNRPAFHFTSNGANAVQSSYLTQPRKVGGNNLTFDADGELTAFTPVVPHLLGNALTWGAPNPAPTNPGARNFNAPSGIITDIDPLTHNTYDAATYSYPREYDKTCGLDSNNTELDGFGNPIWDQRTIRTSGATLQDGGWIAELDVVDLDNLDLRPSEPYEPVYLSLSHDALVSGIQGLILFCEYDAPNPDNLTYQTYGATTDINGIQYTQKDPEKCKWTNNPTPMLQPISVFYQGRKDDGSFANRKMVYHRLRFKWQPKDNALVANFIKNHLNNFLIYGDRYRTLANKTELEAIQDRTLYSSIEMVAARKNHKPCVNFGQSTYIARYPIIHDANTNVNDLSFSVKDENRTGEGGNTSALNGRYQAEVFPIAANVAGLKSIDHADFARFVPFLLNCTSLTSSNVSAPEPLIWYAGADKLPRTRLTSRLNAVPVSGSPFCMRFKYSAYKELGASGRIFDKVALFQSSGPATVNLASFTQGGKECFTQSSFTFTANDRYALLATPCTNISYSSGGVTGVILSDLDPTQVSNGAFPAGSELIMKFFPQFYGADYGLNRNSFHFDAAGVDTFVFDPATGLNQRLEVRDEITPTNGQYDDLSLVVNTTAANNLGETPTPLTGMPGAGLFGYVDWDHQPSQIALPTGTPAPTSVFYRVNPSGVLQIFAKGTTPVSVPLQVTHRMTGPGLPATGIESDPFDIIEYPSAYLTPQPGFTSASSVPTFSAPAGRSSCVDAPTGSAAGFLNAVLTSGLTYNTLESYRKCMLNWTPSSNDIGKSYNYQFYTQDNYGATANSNNIRTAYGKGAVHPNGSIPGTSFYIPNDSWASVHGPYSYFYVFLESIEDNLAPYFVNSAGSTNSAKYCTSVSTATGCATSTPNAAWATIFGGSGTQPSACTAGGGFTCPSVGAGSTIMDGDTILSTSPVTLTEGTSSTIGVLVRDDNVTAALKNISAQAPRKVLVVKKYINAGDPGWVKTYTVNSFSTMTLGVSSTILSDSKSATQFRFDWKPTDEEAYQLSNADGFLIPFVVSDQDYIPQPDAGFPSSFNVSKITRTIWVWANLRVRNNSPTISYIGSAGETPLAGATFTFETGKTTTYTIRIKDTDRARYDIGSELTGFTATASSKPAFLSSPPASLASMQSSGAFLYQDFTIKNTATLTPSDIGMYTYDLNVTDPGDPSKCWVENDIASCVNSARASTPMNAISFNVQVVGKPYFLVPHTNSNPALSRNTANVFVNSTSNPTALNYPLSLSISKEAEKGQTFFFGISGTSVSAIPMKTSMTPASTPVPASARGIYINENSVVKWPDASFDLVGNTYDVPIYGIADTYCGTGTDVTLYRYNEAVNAIETCKVSNTNMTNNAAAEHLFLKVNNNYDVPTLGSLTAVTGTRTTTHAAASVAAAKSEASAQYTAFKGRCPTCAGSPTTSGASPSGLALNPSTASGQVSFASNNYQNDFTYSYDGSSTLTVTRSYNDQLPSNAARATAFTVMKGDIAQFSATVSSAPNLRTHYRWYVNGCLKKAGEITSTTINFDLPITILMSGLNNDCTGEYSIAETNSGKLGALRVRLNIVNNIENTTTVTDNATKSYVWNLTVLNNKPNLQVGIPLTADQYNGNLPVTLAVPVSYASKSYLAFVDPSSSLGAAFRMYEIQADGCVSGAGYAVRSSITSAPTTLGVHTSPNLMMAMNNTTAYPAGSSEAATIFKTSSRSFGASLSGSSLSPWNVAQAFNDVAAYSVFSQFSASSLASTYFQISSGSYNASTSTNFFLIDGQDGFGFRSARQYWQNDINANGSSIYGVSGGVNVKPTAMASSSSSSVRRNVITGTGSSSILFQLIGAKNSSANGAISSINILSMYNSGNNLRGTMIKSLGFSASGSAPDCAVDGTPLDGIYVSANDTLYALVYGNAGVGKIVAISNATNASASCTILADVANPSLNASEFNANISKIAIDPVTNFIYGVINRAGGKGSQVYFIDPYSAKVYSQDVSSAINPAALIYSKEQNAVMLFDGDKTSTKTPTLYKIW